MTAPCASTRFKSMKREHRGTPDRRRSVVDLRTALSLAPTTARTRFTIGEAVRFGLYQGQFLDQNALSLIAVSGAAPLEDNSGERGVLTRATGQRRVPRSQEDEMIKVSAGKTLCTTFPGEGDPCAASQRLLALIARGFASRDEYLEVRFLVHWCTKLGWRGRVPVNAGSPQCV